MTSIPGAPTYSPRDAVSAMLAVRAILDGTAVPRIHLDHPELSEAELREASALLLGVVVAFAQRFAERRTP